MNPTSHVESTLELYSTENLFSVLTALFGLHGIALHAKFYGLAETTSLLSSVPAFKSLNWTEGICHNIYKLMPDYSGTSEEYFTVKKLLLTLFLNCPSSTRSGLYPVTPVKGAGYGTSSPEEMWGNHPYADNRRIIIRECIDQLQKELKHRRAKV